ncbi:MAG: redox-regulated ATPase YchF [Candidatus Hodarchaeales archaeon]|jgi:ribosome-binding ATPase YchF (GTP1/OBG family)
MGVLVGIVGKPSSGKTTFLNALCQTDAKTADYPFTTIQPNQGVGFVTTPCVCKEFDVTCNPRNSECVDHVRKIPIKIIDVAGLVPGAYEGKGLGNQFLSDLTQADILIHVLDISGSLNEEGEQVDAGSHDPEKDISFLENEIAQWMNGILKKDWTKAVRKAKSESKNILDFITDKLTGLKIRKAVIQKSISLMNLDTSKVDQWTDEEILGLCQEIRKLGKPIIIAANKIDRSTSAEYYLVLKKKYKENLIPTSALSDIVLRRFADQGKINYVSENGSLSILGELNKKEEEMINKIKTEILDKYGNTGIYETLNQAVFNILGLIPIYPVADASKLSDQDGKILPDAYLVDKGTTVKELAGIIHQDLYKNFIHGIDVRTNRKLSEKQELNSSDVIKIVAAV